MTLIETPPRHRDPRVDDPMIFGASERIRVRAFGPGGGAVRLVTA